MGTVIYISACINRKHLSQPISADYAIWDYDERFEPRRTIKKRKFWYDSCPEFKDNTIYYFEEQYFVRIAPRDVFMREWLDKLQSMVKYQKNGPDAKKPGMFRDLFWGADYDFTFGPDAIYRLLISFQIWREKAKLMCDEEFMETYDLFHEIISWAADNGNGAFWFVAI